jgi:Ca2+:H+ antiporter
MNTFFKFLLIFVPIALIAYLMQAPATSLFFLCAIAIVPLAKFIGEATEEVTLYTGPAFGGILNATLGNATELIISIFALQAGLIDVVKASITGSIIGNLLLVLGMSMFMGGLKNKKQSFNVTAARAHASTLLLALTALVIPAVFLYTTPVSSNDTLQSLSLLVAVGMIVVYMANLLFSLHTHKHLYVEDVAHLEPKWSKTKSISILVFSTFFVAILSDILVNSLEPAIAYLHWTELFVGIVVVAIIGNIAEHTSAITVALKNRMDLSLQISIGSATQMAIFVTPLLVILSILLGHPMNLVFTVFELVAIILSIFITNSVVEDGESNWLEGLQLMTTYIILALAFFFHP